MGANCAPAGRGHVPRDRERGRVRLLRRRWPNRRLHPGQSRGAVAGQSSGRTTIVCGDDFTSRGLGTPMARSAAKGAYLDRLSLELKAPSIRMLDGSSGGWQASRRWCRRRRRKAKALAKESSGSITAGRPRVTGGGGSFLPGHLAQQHVRPATFHGSRRQHVSSAAWLASVAAKAVLGHFSVMVRGHLTALCRGPAGCHARDWATTSRKKTLATGAFTVRMVVRRQPRGD